MINAHVIDGVALTKFIYWIKNLKKLNITEVDAQNKLEYFRKQNPNCFRRKIVNVFAVSGFRFGCDR